MRIVEIEYLGPPATGGVEKVVAEICARFRAAHAPEIWATDLQGFDGLRYAETAATEGGIPVRRFPVSRRHWYLRDPHHLVWRGLRKELAAPAREGSLLHVHSFPSHQADALLHVAGARTAAVLTPHHDVESLRSYSRLRRARSFLAHLRRRLETSPGLLLSMTTALEKEFWVSELGLPAARIEVVPNGVALEEFDAVPEPERAAARALWPAGEFRLLFVGRMAAAKGLDTLLEAVALVQAESVSVLIAGRDARELAKLQRLAQERHLTERVAFAEGLSRERVCACFRESDAVVLPSRYGENFGIVLLEAMAARRPVIGARSGGIPELIQEGRNGLLVPKESPQALAAAIDRLAEDREAGARMGEFGRRLVEERFTWNRVAGLYLRLFARAREGAGLQ